MRAPDYACPLENPEVMSEQIAGYFKCRAQCVGREVLDLEQVDHPEPDRVAEGAQDLCTPVTIGFGIYISIH